MSKNAKHLLIAPSGQGFQESALVQGVPPLRASLDLMDFVEQKDPALFQAAYPRVYREPKTSSYYSPRIVASQAIQIALKVRQGMWGENEKIEFNAFSLLAHYRFPTYYLGLGLTEALGMTKIKGEINWYEMHLPFEAAVFLPPKGTIRHPTDGDLVFIGYARFQTGEEKKSKLAEGIAFGWVNGGMTLYAVSAAGYMYHWNVTLLNHGATITVADLESDATNPDVPRHRSAWPMRTLEMTDHDNKLMVTVAHYVFATLMVMTAKPVLVTDGKLDKRVRNKRNMIREFWTPPVIGENYGVRHVRPEAGTARPKGTHASPRIHWVPGFTRQQAYGAERKLRKTIWVKPFIRGAESEDE